MSLLTKLSLLDDRPIRAGDVLPRVEVRAVAEVRPRVDSRAELRQLLRVVVAVAGVRRAQRDDLAAVGLQLREALLKRLARIACVPVDLRPPVVYQLRKGLPRDLRVEDRGPVGGHAERGPAEDLPQTHAVGPGRRRRVPRLILRLGVD